MSGCVCESVTREVFEAAASAVAGGSVTLVRVDDEGGEVVEVGYDIDISHGAVGGSGGGVRILFRVETATSSFTTSTSSSTTTSDISVSGR